MTQHDPRLLTAEQLQTYWTAFDAASSLLPADLGIVGMGSELGSCEGGGWLEVIVHDNEHATAPTIHGSSFLVSTPQVAVTAVFVPVPGTAGLTIIGGEQG